MGCFAQSFKRESEERYPIAVSLNKRCIIFEFLKFLIVMVKIKSIARPNPLDREADSKFYAQAVATGSTDLERLAYLVSNQSTVREADCYAVLLSLLHNVTDELAQGKIVKLDKLGSFQIGVSSKGVALEEELTASAIKKAHINFRPDKRFRKMLKNVDFTFKE